MKFVGVEESKEFRAFLRGPSRIGISSSKLNWKGVVVEEHSAESGERSAAIADRHILGLVCGRPWTGEHPDGRGGFISNPNLPGMITFIKDGSTVPAISTRDVCEHVLCSLESSFLNSVLDELEKRPAEELHSRLGFYDPPARQIIRLLIAEAGMGGRSDGFTPTIWATLLLRACCSWERQRGAHAGARHRFRVTFCSGPWNK